MRDVWGKVFSRSIVTVSIGSLIGSAAARIEHGEGLWRALTRRGHPPWWVAVTFLVIMFGLSALNAWQSKRLVGLVSEADELRARELKWILNASYHDMQPNGVCGDVHDVGGVRKILGDYLRSRGWLE